MAYNNNSGKREFDNTNRGTLGRNKKKDKNDPSHDKKPDYSGKINIEGRDYWLSGWLRESDGEKFFSLSVQPKDEQRGKDDRSGGGNRYDDKRDAGQRRDDGPRSSRGRDIDDEIPF